MDSGSPASRSTAKVALAAIAALILASTLLAGGRAILTGRPSASVPAFSQSRPSGQIPNTADLIGMNRAAAERALRPFTVLSAPRPMGPHEWARSIGASTTAAYTLADFSDNASPSPASANTHGSARVTLYFGPDGRCIMTSLGLSGTAMHERFPGMEFSEIASNLVSAPVSAVAPPNLWQWVAVSRSKGKLLEGTFTKDGQPWVVFVTWAPSTPIDATLVPGDPGNYTVDVYRTADWLKYSKGLGPPAKTASDPSSK